MKKVKIHKCSKCNKSATWFYLPATRGKFYFCDDCVPRGCTCNVDDIDMAEPDKEFNDRTIWWSKEAYHKCINEKLDPIEFCTRDRQSDSYYYEILDENGRREPCVEFDYSPHGYERERNFYVVDSLNVEKIFNKVLKEKPIGSKEMVNGMQNIISSYNELPIPYNEFMAKIAEVCRPYFIHTMFNKDKLNQRFYNSFRNQVYEKRELI
jgi:hypothetical protein